MITDGSARIPQPGTVICSDDAFTPFDIRVPPIREPSDPLWLQHWSKRRPCKQRALKPAPIPLALPAPSPKTDIVPLFEDAHEERAERKAVQGKIARKLYKCIEDDLVDEVSKQIAKLVLAHTQSLTEEPAELITEQLVHCVLVERRPSVVISRIAVGNAGKRKARLWRDKRLLDECWTRLRIRAFPTALGCSRMRMQPPNNCGFSVIVQRTMEQISKKVNSSYDFNVLENPQVPEFIELVCMELLRKLREHTDEKYSLEEIQKKFPNFGGLFREIWMGFQTEKPEIFRDFIDWVEISKEKLDSEEEMEMERMKDKFVRIPRSAAVGRKPRVVDIKMLESKYNIIKWEPESEEETVVEAAGELIGKEVPEKNSSRSEPNGAKVKLFKTNGVPTAFEVMAKTYASKRKLTRETTSSDSEGEKCVPRKT
ncbi:hypothetical protein L596_014192 [Steinernema carpocapsae]|nr:hypothetical protein L596_014192 [Steinernema carpocapsae]